jgi:hypothetical protein
MAFREAEQRFLLLFLEKEESIRSNNGQLWFAEARERKVKGTPGFIRGSSNMKQGFNLFDVSERSVIRWGVLYQLSRRVKA